MTKLLFMLLSVVIGFPILNITAMPNFDYKIPVYRIEVYEGQWSASEIMYEATLREISLDAVKEAGDDIFVTKWNVDYPYIFKLKDRMLLAGFNAKLVTKMLEYEKVKEEVENAIEEYATFSDLKELEYASIDPLNDREINALTNNFKLKEKDSGITTRELIEYLEPQMPKILAAGENGNLNGCFMAATYYYLRGLAATKDRMTNFRQVGFRDQKYLPLSDDEMRSYLTALQYYQFCADQNSNIREKALYHCAAAIYGMRNQGNKLIRIPQAIEAYQKYIYEYPEGKWAKRAAMNIVGLELELHRLNGLNTESIATTLSLAQDILFRESNTQTLGYEELRVALMMMEMHWGNGSNEAALNIYYPTFNSLDADSLPESLYSTYATALEVAGMIFRAEGEYEKSNDVINRILAICTKDQHFLRGTAKDNINRLQQQIK